MKTYLILFQGGGSVEIKADSVNDNGTVLYFYEEKGEKIAAFPLASIKGFSIIDAISKARDKRRSGDTH